jgi:hypothetical protein
MVDGLNLAVRHAVRPHDMHSHDMHSHKMLALAPFVDIA